MCLQGERVFHVKRYPECGGKRYFIAPSYYLGRFFMTYLSDCDYENIHIITAENGGVGRNHRLSVSQKKRILYYGAQLYEEMR